MDVRIDELTSQLASHRAKVGFLTAKLSNLEDALKKVDRDHDGFVKKIRTETKRR